MKSLFNHDFFSGNRANLRDHFPGSAPIVITAAGSLQKSADETYIFKQDANFWYLTGLDEPDLILVIDGAKEYLIAPTRSSTREIFEGRLMEQDIVERSGIADIRDDKAGWRDLGARLKKVRHVATLSPPPGYVPQLGFYTNPARAQLIERLRTYQPEIQLIDLGLTLAHLRSVKQAPELAAIRAAIANSIASFKATFSKAKVKEYHNEYEIEAELFNQIRRRGARGLGFDTIVASGTNAGTIHYLANRSRLKRRDLILIDFGAEVDHYSADLTRTVCLSQPTKRQQAIYEAVKAARDYIDSLLKPGLLLKELEQSMVDFMGQQLVSLGLINIQAEETIRRYFPHAVAHMLGLNLHDPADYNQPLKEGAVLAIEPGIYIAEEGIGVRLEDDILITKSGFENLSRALPHSLRIG